MLDNIIMEKLYQDIDFFEVKLTCSSEIITATDKYYISSDNFKNLLTNMNGFLTGEIDEYFWSSGKTGDDTTACFSLQFLREDKLGHVLLEVYMELNDGAKLSRHNCCFYVRTELGLLTEFHKDLSVIIEQQLGDKIILNPD